MALSVLLASLWRTDITSYLPANSCTSTESSLSTGGHEWANRRRYRYQTAQIMFPDCPVK
jgi:hypothetical protein